MILEGYDPINLLQNKEKETKEETPPMVNIFVDTPHQNHPMLEEDHLKYPTNVLMIDGLKKIIKNSFLKDIIASRMWEYQAKVIYKEILARYPNFGKREYFYNLIKNELEKLEALYKQITLSEEKITNTYSDEELNMILNKLENLNIEAQAYYNAWVVDMGSVGIA